MEVNHQRPLSSQLHASYNSMTGHLAVPNLITWYLAILHIIYVFNQIKTAYMCEVFAVKQLLPARHGSLAWHEGTMRPDNVTAGLQCYQRLLATPGHFVAVAHHHYYDVSQTGTRQSMQTIILIVFPIEIYGASVQKEHMMFYECVNNIRVSHHQRYVNHVFYLLLKSIYTCDIYWYTMWYIRCH